MREFPEGIERYDGEMLRRAYEHANCSTKRGLTGEAWVQFFMHLCRAGVPCVTLAILDCEFEGGDIEESLVKFSRFDPMECAHAAARVLDWGHA
jgi:hypothetical protein